MKMKTLIAILLIASAQFSFAESTDNPNTKERYQLMEFYDKEARANIVYRIDSETGKVWVAVPSFGKAGTFREASFINTDLPKPTLILKEKAEKSSWKSRAQEFEETDVTTIADNPKAAEKHNAFLAERKKRCEQEILDQTDSFISDECQE
jgi:hypothetical protein